MVIPSYLVLLAIVTAMDMVTGTEDDVFMECMDYEICKQDGGKDKVIECLDMLAEFDKEYAAAFFSEYYKMSYTSADFMKLVETACSDPEEGKKAFNEYYDARKKQAAEKEDTQPENEKKMVEARNCVCRIFEGCMVKKTMGLA